MLSPADFRIAHPFRDEGMFTHYTVSRVFWREIVYKGDYFPPVSDWRKHIQCQALFMVQQSTMYMYRGEWLPFLVSGSIYINIYK